jgi:hypothetical protein
MDGGMSLLVEVFLRQARYCSGKKHYASAQAECKNFGDFYFGELTDCDQGCLRDKPLHKLAAMLASLVRF